MCDELVEEMENFGQWSGGKHTVLFQLIHLFRFERPVCTGDGNKTPAAQQCHPFQALFLPA
ncbi:UNVERIFIED_CONTAM: hypothetical protein FKN15_046367 [Acipenser sinensis]